jgi:hypothetical protein
MTGSIEWLPVTVPAMGSAFEGMPGRFCGIRFQMCSAEHPCFCPMRGSMEDVYKEAVHATEWVPQYRYVEVYWLGSLVGLLRGQC